MVAHQARSKLAKEAQASDHNLHRLVCHANMLDTLILDLAQAEQQQESYLNKLSQKASPRPRKAKAEKYDFVVMEKLTEESEEDSDNSSDSDPESDDECEHWDPKTFNATATMIASDEEVDADELQEEYARLSLERTISRKEAQVTRRVEHIEYVKAR